MLFRPSSTTFTGCSSFTPSAICQENKAFGTLELDRRQGITKARPTTPLNSSWSTLDGKAPGTEKNVHYRLNTFHLFLCGGWSELISFLLAYLHPKRAWAVGFKFKLMDNKDPIVLHSQRHACWCSGDVNNQCISEHGINMGVLKSVITNHGSRQLSVKKISGALSNDSDCKATGFGITSTKNIGWNVLNTYPCHNYKLITCTAMFYISPIIVPRDSIRVIPLLLRLFHSLLAQPYQQALNLLGH